MSSKSIWAQVLRGLGLAALLIAFGALLAPAWASGSSSAPSGAKAVYYHLYPTAGPGGTITPNIPAGVPVAQGDDYTFTFRANDCYSVADVQVDGHSVVPLPDSEYRFVNVQTDHTINVTFSHNGPYDITATAGSDGSISPSGTTSVTCGDNQAYTITPASCHHIVDVLVDGVSVGAVASYSFNNVHAGHTIAASFAIDPYTITASAGANGTISPNGATTVNCGFSQAYTITPAACYHVTDVLVDGVSKGAITSYTFSDVEANHTIAASFAIDTHTIAASAGANGTISPNGTTTLDCGSTQAYSITPADCYHVASVLVDGVDVGAVTSYTFSDVEASHTIAASFAINTYAIVASAGSNGTIGPNGTTTLDCGSTQAFAITPADCYHVTDVLVDGVSVGAVASYTFTNVRADHTIAATFAIDGPYTITASAGANGAVSPAGATVEICGSNQSYSITPASCYHIVDVLVDGVSVGAVTSYTFDHVHADHTLSASFAIDTYAITASASAGGSVSPSGTTTVDCGTSQTYSITPNSGWYLTGLLVDGAPVALATSYTFTNVTQGHTIAASFTLDIANFAVGSSTTVLCPTNTCVTLPVTFTRNGVTPVLGYAVTFQLGGGLELCSGGAGAVEGSFLSAFGGTHFTVTDHGSGLITVSDALTSSCGPAGTSGALFSLGVASTSPGGTGTVTLTNVQLLDCASTPMTTAMGPASSVPIDNEAPSVSVLSPNGSEAMLPGQTFTIQWTATDNVGIANVDLAYSTDGGATYAHTIATAIANSGSYAWTVPNVATSTARVRVTAHDVNCSSASDASDGDFAIGGGIVSLVPPGGCLTPAHNCATVPVDIARSDNTGLRLFHVDFQLSSNLKLCSTPVASVLEGTYLKAVNPVTTFWVVDNGGGSYTADGTINGLPCGATASTGNLFSIAVAANGGSGTGTITITDVTFRDCVNNNLVPASAGAPLHLTIDAAPVAVAAIPTPQTVVELSSLTITPAVTIAACATGPATWSVTPALPSGAALNPATGVITWTPACGTAGSYGPFTLKATAASGDFGTSNPFAIQVTHLTGTVTVAAISTPQTVVEQSTLTLTPSATTTSCAGTLAWSVSPALPSGATFSTTTGVITWTPACGTAGSYGPFTLTATAATGEAGASNAFSIAVTHKVGTVTVTAIATPQTVVEQSTLTLTPSATLTSCAAGPLTWSVSPALPSGATFSPTTGEIVWTPACGEAGSYGPFTLTATAATGEVGASNTFGIDVTHKAGTVTVAAIATPQTVVEQSTLTLTPSATLTSCAAGTLTWSVSPALPSGATFSTTTGEIVWTPACGEAGSYGPFTLTATAATGEVGASNAFGITVTHKVGMVTVAAISTPQSVVELSTLTITPSATETPCASTVSWSVSPALPSGATFSTTTGVITWTPACGTAGSYGPFTLTATAATGEAGASNAFSITVTHKVGTVTVAAIATPQTVVEQSTLTVTPSATLTDCAAGPVTWDVSLAPTANARSRSTVKSAADLPAGATFNPATGVITWTPDCGTAGTYGPYVLTATAATGEIGTSNAFAITVTHKVGTVTVAAIATPQTVIEQSTLTLTPSATLTSCAAAPLTWSVSPALPSGATFSTVTGTITWTPACGDAGSYGPFTLTASAATGETGASNAFGITVTHKVGTVTVAAISTPQTVAELATLTLTPSATETPCASTVTWSVSPALPSGATFSTATGEIVWTPACGEAGSYGPFTLTATAATGEAGASNAFSITVTHKVGTVTVAAISTPQTVVELSTLTVTPSATLTSCAAGTLTWSVSPALPSGATFSTTTGEIVWTPACGEAGSYGPFTLTATAATGEVGASNAFGITVTHKAGTVTVAAIATPQTVVEQSTLTLTPSATLTSCAAGTLTWSVSPALPSGATFSTTTGEIVWTPACGEAGSYGPFTLTATAATGEVGASNAFGITVTHKVGTVTVAAISTPQTVVELSTLTITPSATETPCASTVTWSVSPALPSGATFSTTTGVITWTPACGTAGSYGPFTLTATAATGEAGASNAFSITVTHKVGTVTVAAIATPQTVVEQSTLTVTPSATLTDCAAGPVTWDVSLAPTANARSRSTVKSAADLPAGATFNPATGVITWTPDCGTAGSYGPYVLTATAATGEVGTSNAFSITVTHKVGTVTVAAIATPQTVIEQSTLTLTPSATLTSCAAAPLTWSVSPALPSGATFSTVTGTITWTPACGEAGSYGPFTLTASAATGETGASNAFGITVTHKVGTVTVAAIATPQTVAELATLTLTPSATETPCASTVTWSVSPALPSGATFSTATGVITWTPACGEAGSYGPFTLTATAATGEAGTSNAFGITVTHKVGTVTVAAIATPQTVVELATLTVTPSATLTSCAAGTLTWSVSPALPSGATFSTTTGVITWTPDCGTAGSYGPYVLTATAATGEVGASNAFGITVTHKAGTVTIAAIATPQTVIEQSTLTFTPSATLTSCAAGPLTWAVSPALPSGATFNTATGVITWTPACGTYSTYGPFTLTATAATGETGVGNLFFITVTHKAGTVTVAAIATPQTVAELAALTITPSATLTSCAAGPLAWTISPALPAWATLNAVTGVVTLNPDCAAHEAAAGGDYGPFTLTATAATSEVGNSNSFVIHVDDTPVAISAPTGVTAAQILTGNPAGNRTNILIGFTPPSGATAIKVYRAGFGHYPYYDDDGGATPAQPTTYPPAAPWTLTSVTTSGTLDLPPVRDYWYYVVYAQNACGDWSVASTMTTGTLGYHLGDVSNGLVAGMGDNRVYTPDISLLGDNYGITLTADDPVGYLDVGPTTTHYVDGRPLTDRKVNFEDLVMFSINFSHVSMPANPAGVTGTSGPLANKGNAGAAKAATSDLLVLSSPDQVAMGEPVTAKLTMEGTGAVQAASIQLSWDPAVVEPQSPAMGDLLQQLDGIVLSARPGNVDAAVFGMGRGFEGEGDLATVTFKVLAAGDPKIRIVSVDARSTHNDPVTLATSRITSAPEVPLVTALMPAMPNPFRQNVTLAITLTHRSPVDVSIFSVDGRRVRQITNASFDAGAYRFDWDGRDRSGNAMPAGVYYARMIAGTVTSTRTLTLLR